MGVQLNIKSAEARELAERIAQKTGETITEAITRALRMRLRELQIEQGSRDEITRQRQAEFYRIIGGSRMRWKDAMLSIDHADILYDEYGLPR